MKKILLTLSTVALLAAGCNSSGQNPPPVTATPIPSATETTFGAPAATPTIATPTPAATITEQQAINIVVTQKKVDTATQNITATFKNGNWYVDTSPKQPTCTTPPCAVTTGGNAEYIVDGKTGAIISTELGQ